MRKRSGRYDPAIVDLLEKIKPKEVHATVKNLSFKDVIPGMIAVEDVFAKNGAMLIPKGQEITWPVIQSLTNFEKQIAVFLLNGDAGEEALKSKFEVLQQLLLTRRHIIEILGDLEIDNS